MSTTTQRCSRHSTDTVLEFHAKAPQATVSEGLVHGPYVVARAGLEPATIRMKGVKSTNEPPRPTCYAVKHTDFTVTFPEKENHYMFLAFRVS